jgi:hypothetical protein
MTKMKSVAQVELEALTRALDWVDSVRSSPAMRTLKPSERISALSAALGRQLAKHVKSDRQLEKGFDRQAIAAQFIKSFLIELGTHTEQDFERMGQEILAFQRLTNNAEGLA